jgi:hypothetical protein
LGVTLYKGHHAKLSRRQTEKGKDMKWHVYKTSSVDSFWNNLKTVEETERQIERNESISLLVVDAQPEGPVASAFVKGWLDAKAAVCESGWDGVERSMPVVFWLPSNSDFLYGFVIKPDTEDGTTLIASPYPLPWLDIMQEAAQ